MFLNRLSRAASAVLLLTVSLIFSAAAQEQPSPSAAPNPGTTAANSPQRPRYIYRKHTLEDRVKDLAKKLDLDEEQQAGVKGVLERQQLQARKIQFDQTLSGEERISLFRDLQEDSVLRIRALLNDEQKKKYDPLNHSPDQADSSKPYIDNWLKQGTHK